MTEADVIARLKAACDVAGSQKAWAAAHNMTAQWVHDVISGRRAPGQSILDALGLERVVTYRPAPKGEE